MQGSHGRGGGRPGYTGRGNGGVNNMGGGVTYGGMVPGYVYNNWSGYNNYHVQGLMPMPPAMPRTYGRGSGSRAFVPLGVQGAGILKRPTGPPQGHVPQGRGHSRGHGGKSWGGRGRKNLTKEALDADLDEWRMKDKKFGGQSLDADLDDYWKKKDETDAQEVENKDSKVKEGEGSGPTKDAIEKPAAAAAAATTSPRQSNDGKESPDAAKSEVLSKDR